LDLTQCRNQRSFIGSVPREKLIEAERLNGKTGYTVDEVSAMMKAAIQEVIDGKAPKQNPLLSNPSLPINKYRKLSIYKRYLLIYQIKGSTVYIDAVVDCRQNYRWLLYI